MNDEPEYGEYENYGDAVNSEENSKPAAKRGFGKFKKLFEWKWGELVILGVLSAFALLFTIIFYSIKFTDFFCLGVERADFSFWSAKLLYGGASVANSWYIENFNVYFNIAFWVAIALYAVAFILLLVKKNNLFFLIASAYNALIALVCMVIGNATGIMRGGATTCCIITIMFSAALMAYALIRRKISRALKAGHEEVKEEEISPLPQKKSKVCKIAMIVCGSVSLAVLFIAFFIPVYSEVTGNSVVSYTLMDAMSANSVPVYISIGFIALFIAFFAEILSFASVVSDYFRSDRAFIERSKRYMTSTTVIALVFFIFGFCLSFIFNISDAETATADYAAKLSYIPFVLAVISLIVYSVFCGMLRVPVPTRDTRKSYRVEPLLFAAAMTAVTFVSLAFNVVEIHAGIDGHGGLYDVSISGYQLLTTYKELEGGFQLLAFIEFLVIVSSGLLMAFSLVAYFSKDKNYYKIVKSAALSNFLFLLFIGLFGIYFKIAQKINIENIESLLAYYGLSLGDSYTYEVDSQTIYLLIADVAIVIAMLVRGIFSLGVDRYVASGEIERAPEEESPSPLPQSAPAQEQPATGAVKAVDFDACPAFTELDSKQAEFNLQLAERRRHVFNNPTLPNLVRFIVDYARECRLHLSYTPEDIATFIAGLGASRLAILQGMSGTGKTSLPKVFMEAVMGNCEIVEVESSWRDKNELLGYYNEFSRCFTPKKFTQCLYKARLNPTVMTFIVLDEMNLSRIEYYFSDFLSLMENEEDKREIKLLNVKLSRTENGVKKTYDGLVDGHTVKVPANVWFIGTANRDESTFEISDKVYDRALTMNFNKRAAKIRSFSTPLDRRFVPYDMLLKLFNSAKVGYRFEAEDNVAIQKAEKLLAPYNISFGNRILKQMEDFVKIYCTCFNEKPEAEQEAVESILLSKVVSKLETKVVENKEALAREFDRIGLKNCGAFIRKLNED